MEFCPSCKSFMIPKNTGNKTVLVCRRCGTKVDKFSASKYRITERARHKHGDILVVEEDKKRKSEEERKYITDLYGSEMYEMEE
ncbi:MAG: hypothetical protein ABH874_04780 [Methanobacteriota archaeon]